MFKYVKHTGGGIFQGHASLETSSEVQDKANNKSLPICYALDVETYVGMAGEERLIRIIIMTRL